MKFDSVLCDDQRKWFFKIDSKFSKTIILSTWTKKVGINLKSKNNNWLKLWRKSQMAERTLAIERIHLNVLERHVERRAKHTNTIASLTFIHRHLKRYCFNDFIATRTSLIFFLARNVNPCANFFFIFIAGVVLILSKSLSIK